MQSNARHSMRMYAAGNRRLPAVKVAILRCAKDDIQTGEPKNARCVVRSITRRGV